MTNGEHFGGFETVPAGTVAGLGAAMVGGETDFDPRVSEAGRVHDVTLGIVGTKMDDDLNLIPHQEPSHSQVTFED